MKRSEFYILRNALKNKNETSADLAKQAFCSIEEIEKSKKEVVNNHLLTGDGHLTDSGLKALEPYKVDNAIIMAAGLSSRCLPLSKILPKGLFRVKGEILIEREIEQLKAAGINTIILVTGYMKEQFEYLKEKYGLILVENKEYKERNNTSSLMAARKYLANSYICCADNYFTENIFESYVYDSYYTVKHTDEYLDEFCIVEEESGYIKKIQRGSQNCYYTMGATYYSREFSKKFIDLLTKEYNLDETKGMLIDTFHMNHLDELPSTYVPYPDDVILEFDTLKEFSDFDTDFVNFYNKIMEEHLFDRYKNINRYAGVPTDWVSGRLHYNENLWGPSPKCLDELYKTTPEDLYLYDSTEEDDLQIALEEKLGISRKNLFLHNGSAESIKTLFSVMLNKDDNVLLPTPGWSYYGGVVDYKFGNKIYYDIIEDGDKCAHNIDDIIAKAKQYSPKIIVITNPAMPTGNAMSAENIEKIIKMFPGSMILLDEAYHGFAPYTLDVKRIINTYDNVVFSRTFSKYYGLANLRIGYGICSTAAMHALWLDLPLHRLPHISKRMAIAALNDNAYYKEVTDEMISVREWFWKELNKIPNVHPFKSDSNFMYIGLTGYDVSGIKQYMQENGYLIRIFDSHEAQHLRITIAPKEIMEDCLNKLMAALQYNKL